MFSAPGVKPACGMFNIEHLIAVIVCLLLVVLAIIFTRKFNYKKINTLLKITTFVITILEIIKIAFNIYYEGFSYPNNFIPLHFCSLFIYSLWFSGFGKNKIKKLLLGYNLTDGTVEEFTESNKEVIESAAKELLDRMVAQMTN